MLSAPLTTPAVSTPTTSEPIVTALEPSGETQQTNTQGSEVEPSQKGGQPEGQSQAPVAPKRLLSDEDFQGIAGAVVQALPQTQGQGQPQQQNYTQEQIDELLHVWKPNAAWYEKMSRGGEDGLAAAVELRDGLNKQFTRRLQLELAQLREELRPGLQAATQGQIQAAEDRFYKSNKDLDAHRDVVNFTFQTLKSKGALEGMDQQKVQKTVADEARAWLKTKGIASAATNVAQQNGRKVPAQMSDRSNGGSGGSSASTNPAMAALRRIG